MKITHLSHKRFIAISAFASLLYAILAMVAGVHWAVSLGIGALLFLSIFWRFRMPDLPWWGKQLLMFGHSVAVFIIIQFAVGTHLARIGVVKFMLNVLLVYGLVLIFSAVTTSIKAGVLIVFGYSLIFAIIDHFVVQTRSFELQFADIKAATTAMAVAGDYEYTINAYCAGALFATLPLLVLVITNKYPRLKGILPISVNSVCGIIAVALVTAIVSSNAGAQLIGYQAKYWLYHTSRNNGFYLGLVKSITASPIEMPEGYTIDSLQIGLDHVLGENAADKEVVVDPEARPNVIVIMNETFSDLNYVSEAFGNGGIAMSDNPLEYFNSFSDDADNVIKGFSYASIFGGNTANSELEFLTGSSMAFIDSNTVPYNTLINEKNAFSIVDIFENYGYYTVGMHPENKSNWSRNKVYEYFGFDEQYFLRANGSFVDNEKLADEDYFRGHVSDKTIYEKIIGLYENREENTPMFAFAVTMANHGGYSTEDFEYTVTATDNDYPKLNEYLSCVDRSDEDLKTLIEYFSNIDEETLIVFFGDHQPSLNSEVYSTYFGIDGNSDTATTMAKYLVPYMVWSNRSLGEDQGTGYTTSFNYLGSRLLDLIGFEKTAYLDLVQKVEEQYPVINAHGWWDKNYVFHEIDKSNLSANEGNYEEGMSSINGNVEIEDNHLPIILLYYWTEYNLLKDKDDRLNEYFALNYDKNKKSYTDITD